MGSVSERIRDLGRRGEAALVAYVMAGHPNAAVSRQAVRGIVRGGADIIELGYPFSDSLADGPVIQGAATVSLERGMTMRMYVEAVASAQKITDVPLISMTYSNIFERHGYDALIARLCGAGINGIVLPDMPVDESTRYTNAARRAGAETIFLASPNTEPERLTRIVGASSGFVYLVGVYGTTGKRRGVAPYTIRAIRTTKRRAHGIPVGVGFGISTPQDVQKCVRAGADAVVVGSPIVEMVAKTPAAEVESRVASYVSRMKRATVR